MRFAHVLFISLSVAPLFAQTINIAPREIRAGKSATLTWETGEGHAFVIGYGKKVFGTGSVEVTPATSTQFTLVAETDTGFQYSTVRLVVNNARGIDGFPSLNDFGIGVQGSRKDTNYIDFQDYVWSTLQTKEYGIKGDYVPRRPSVTFYTDFVPRPDLVLKGEEINGAKIKGRRLALAVDIFEPPQGDRSMHLIHFAVRSRLEFQYLGEDDDWHWEKDSQLAKTEAAKMLRCLESGRCSESGQ